jgi:thiol:disulfide interchange protein DsbD
VGGLILNLMPCVFPVLSIKILSLMQESEHIRLHGWIYMAGVILSFVAVAGVLIGLRASGAEIGWGYQLQSPLVVSVLVYLFLLIGLNLSGYFEIGGSVMNLGQGFSNSSGYVSSFLTGVLATVVAAPCTAPFMATAIGFALTQSSFNSLAIFASLGFGMAVPYVLLCYSPALLKRLPRPGAWMERTKELLSFPMFASAIWLLWVLSVQTGSPGIMFTGAGALCLVFGIWLLKNLSRARVPRLLTQLVVVGLFVSAMYFPNLLQTVASADSADAVSKGYTGRMVGYTGPVYEAYSATRLDELRQEGPVFVNFGAAWCITCKVNEAVALDTANMRQMFESLGIKYLKGDWTNQDPAITRKLTQYGRSGVPLYLLYADQVSDAVVLPQILTEGVLLDAFEGL